MKSSSAFKETKKHGASDFPFEKYDISSNYVRQFATSHWHVETELIHVKKGSIKIIINGNSFIGKSGDIFVINSGEMHEIEGLKAPLQYTALVFDFNMLSFRENDLSQQKFIEPVLTGVMRFSNHIATSENINHLLEYILKINQKQHDVYTLATKASLLQFFAFLIDEKQFTLSKKPTATVENNNILKEIVGFINENFSHELTLRQIAKQFNMSHKYFCRFFKNNFQKTFITYLNDVRLENAIQILENKNISITETAISCGFSNMSYFTRTFRKKVGCTPSEYKKKEE